MNSTLDKLIRRGEAREFQLTETQRAQILDVLRQRPAVAQRFAENKQGAFVLLLDERDQQGRPVAMVVFEGKAGS